MRVYVDTEATFVVISLQINGSKVAYLGVVSFLKIP